MSCPRHSAAFRIPTREAKMKATNKRPTAIDDDQDDPDARVFTYSDVARGAPARAVKGCEFESQDAYVARIPETFVEDCASDDNGNGMDDDIDHREANGDFDAGGFHTGAAFVLDGATDNDHDALVDSSDDERDVRAALFVDEEHVVPDGVVHRQPPALDVDERREKTHRQALWDGRDTELLWCALDVKLGQVDWKDEAAMIRALDQIFRYRALGYGGDATRLAHGAWGFFVAFKDGCLQVPSSSANHSPYGVWCCVMCAQSGSTRMPLFFYDGNASHMHRHVKSVHKHEFDAYVSAPGTVFKKSNARQSIKHGVSRSDQSKSALKSTLRDAPEETDKVKVQRALWLLAAWTMNKGLPVHVPTEEIFNMLWFEACGKKLPTFTKKSVRDVIGQWEKIAIGRTNEEIARAEFVSLSFDLWMTCAGKDVFALVAHFTIDATHVSRVLCVVDNRSLSSEEMQASIVDAAKVYKSLCGKVVALISDQGSNVQAVHKALMRGELGLFHPMHLPAQLLCAAHRFATIIRHAMATLKPTPLYPPADAPLAFNLAPRAKKNDSKTDNGRSAQDSGYFGVGVFFYGELMARLSRCALFLSKSSVARRELRDLGLALEGEDGEFKLEFEDAIAGRPKVVPKTRFVYTVQMIADALKLRSKMKAAYELETTALKTARLNTRVTTWKAADIITPSAYSVLDNMHRALRTIGNHTTLAQTTQHYTFCDVGLVALMARAESVREAARARTQRREMEKNSTLELAVELWVKRAAEKATEVLSSTIVKRLDEEFEGMNAYVASAARGENVDGCNADAVCASMLVSLFLHPVVWYAPELHEAITDEARDSEELFSASKPVHRFMKAILDDVLCETVTKGALAVDNVDETPPSIEDVAANVASDAFDASDIWGLGGVHDVCEERRVRDSVQLEAKAYIASVVAQRAVHVNKIHSPVALPQRSGTSMTILQWWSTEFARTKLPLLSRYARMLFSIPQTQCDCERVFSFLGRISKGNRANTSVGTMQRLARINSSLSPEVMYSIARHGLESVPTVSTTTFSVDASPATQSSVGYDHERAIQNRARAEMAEARAQHNSERLAQELQEELRAPANAFADARHAEIAEAEEAANENANNNAVPATPVRRSTRERKKSRRNGTTPAKATTTQART